MRVSLINVRFSIIVLGLFLAMSATEKVTLAKSQSLSESMSTEELESSFKGFKAAFEISDLKTG